MTTQDADALLAGELRHQARQRREAFKASIPSIIQEIRISLGELPGPIPLVELRKRDLNHTPEAPRFDPLSSSFLTNITIPSGRGFQLW